MLVKKHAIFRDNKEPDFFLFIFWAPDFVTGKAVRNVVLFFFFFFEMNSNTKKKK